MQATSFVSRIALVGILIAVAACPGPQTPVSPAPEQARDCTRKTPLRVTLYTWVPEVASFATWIEKDFEAKHCDIDLIVRDPRKSDKYGHKEHYVADLAYDYEKTAAALKGEGDPHDVQDVIEVDTMILGYLKDQEAIARFDVKRNYLPAASRAVTIENEVYGVPHWTCGYFVISELDVRQPKSRTELLDLLRSAGSSRPDLVGYLDSSWDAIMVYLDTLRDSNESSDLTAALKAETIDSAAASSLKGIGAACAKDGTSLCTDGDIAAKMFASGEADALIGYSERLFPVLSAPGTKATADTLNIASATFGDGDNPMLFTDALVLSPKCKDACAEAAVRFADYYVSDETMVAALLSGDLGENATPRYLLPSTRTALEHPRVVSDRLYGQLKVEIDGAIPFPTYGVPDARASKKIRPQVQTALGIPTD